MTNEEIKIAIVGDCSDWNLKGITKDDIPLEIREKIQHCDIFIFNLEGPIINDQIVAEGVITNSFVKNFLNIMGKLQPVVTNSENILDVVNLSKINVACLANNHILDAGKGGIDFTLESLDRNGFLFFGAGRNISEASVPLIITIKGKKVGLVNYNFVGWRKIGVFVNLFGATQKRAGANYTNKQRIVEEVSKLSEQVDYTIALIHIGKELHEKLTLKEQQFLDALDVDLIVIHHAHIAQSVDSNKIISCGDFVFNFPDHLPDSRVAKMVIFQPDLKNNLDIEQIIIRGGISNAK